MKEIDHAAPTGSCRARNGFPRLSREREIARRRDQLTPERRLNETGADLTDWACRHDEYEEDRRRRVSAQRNPPISSWRAGYLFG